jgi:hypothetical protein
LNSARALTERGDDARAQNFERRRDCHFQSMRAVVDHAKFQPDERRAHPGGGAAFSNDARNGGGELNAARETKTGVDGRHARFRQIRSNPSHDRQRQRRRPRFHHTRIIQPAEWRRASCQHGRGRKLARRWRRAVLVVLAFSLGVGG